MEEMPIKGLQRVLIALAVFRRKVKK